MTRCDEGKRTILIVRLQGRYQDFHLGEGVAPAKVPGSSRVVLMLSRAI